MPNDGTITNTSYYGHYYAKQGPGLQHLFGNHFDVQWIGGPDP